MIWIQCPHCGKWNYQYVGEMGLSPRQCKKCGEWFGVLISTVKEVSGDN